MQRQSFLFVVVIVLLVVTIFAVTKKRKKDLSNPNSPRPQLQYTPPSSIPPPAPRVKYFKPDIRQGGRDLEATNMSQMGGQVRGASRGTQIHEAVHGVNMDLTGRIGGTELRPSRGYTAYYFWGENQYLVVPASGFPKSAVSPSIPLETISRYTFNTYFGSMFANRDANHILNDFVAELSGFEVNSPDLLRDMLIYSVALGYERRARNDDRLEQYQAANQYLIERAVRKSINLQTFRTSQSQKAIALRAYLVDTYGVNWTRSVLGF